MFKRCYIQHLLSFPILSPAVVRGPQVLIYSCNRSAYGGVHELSDWWKAETSAGKPTQTVLCVSRRAGENATEFDHRIDTAVELRLIGPTVAALADSGGWTLTQRPQCFSIWAWPGARAIRTSLQFTHPDVLFSSQDILFSKVLSALEETRPNKVFLFQFSSIHHWYTDATGETGNVAI